MTNDKMTLRNKLVDIALDWQENFGVAPSITRAISEYDAAMLIGMPESEYSDYMQDKTAESQGQVRWFVICRESVVPVPMIRESVMPGQMNCHGPKTMICFNLKWKKYILHFTFYKISEY